MTADAATFRRQDMAKGALFDSGLGCCSCLFFPLSWKVVTQRRCGGSHSDSALQTVCSPSRTVSAGREAAIWLRVAPSKRFGAPWCRTIDNRAELRDAILNGFEDANGAVQALGIGAATTLAVVEVKENIVRPYHVGDSMILVVGQRGKIKLQSVPHSPVGYGVESGLLDEKEAMYHEERHLVSNVVGSPDMRIESGLDTGAGSERHVAHCQ